MPELQRSFSSHVAGTPPAVTLVMGVQQKREGGHLRQRTFSLVASVVLGLIAIGHVLRIVLNWSIVI